MLTKRSGALEIMFRNTKKCIERMGSVDAKVVMNLVTFSFNLSRCLTLYVKKKT